MIRRLLNPWTDARELRQEQSRLLERCACLEVELLYRDKQIAVRDRGMAQLNNTNRTLRAECEAQAIALRALGDSYMGDYQ